MAKSKKNKVKKAAKKTANIAKNSAKKVGKQVAENPKNTLYIVGGALAIYLGYKAVFYINDMFNGDGGVDNNIDFVYTINRSKLSITNNQATNYAAQLLAAFNYRQSNPFIPTGAATDEDIIEQIFDSINAEDFKLIFNEFGKKSYSKIYGGSPDANWIGGQTSSKEDLIWWLKEELSSIWDNTLYNKVKQKVEAAGSVF